MPAQSLLVHLLVVLLVVGVAGWLLATYVSGALAALVVAIGVVYALIILLRSSGTRTL